VKELCILNRTHLLKLINLKQVVHSATISLLHSYKYIFHCGRNTRSCNIEWVLYYFIVFCIPLLLHLPCSNISNFSIIHKSFQQGYIESLYHYWQIFLYSLHPYNNNWYCFDHNITIKIWNNCFLHILNRSLQKYALITLNLVDYNIN
jgi:hypothetical protein